MDREGNASQEKIIGLNIILPNLHTVEQATERVALIFILCMVLSQLGPNTGYATDL